MTAWPGDAAEIDLTNCDREPIHLLGGVQPFGFLVAATSDWIITRLSANAPDWLGRPVDELLGTSLPQLFAPEALHSIRNALTVLRGDDVIERLFALPLFGDGRLFDLAVHMQGGRVVMEFEPAEVRERAGAGSIVRTLIRRLQRTTDADSFRREAVRQLQALTGFDRVMIYRFQPDDSGEVIAETLRPGMEPFLGLRYPASDIPRQARALYERNWLRIIADVNAEPVPILPALDPAGQPLDLSLSVLRAVSPIHLEYLRNMGVAASMSVSILRGGRLWGLFACHHQTPRTLDFERRTAAELFAQMFSLLLDSREREIEMEYDASARRLHNQLMAAMAAEASAFENVAGLADAMADLIPCDGVGIWVEGQATLKGATPTPEEFQGLVRFLNRAAASSVYATHELGRVHEPAAEFAERAAGLLAIPVSRTPRDYIVFFRREVVRSVTWAGNPNKPVVAGPHGSRLTPRQSFEAWREIVRGQSPAWSPAELQVAESLRITLLEVILRLSDVAQKERKAAAERQDLLIAELNHRVRNILGLVRGIISQSRSDVGSVEEFASVLGGRVQALARAHDQITTDHWGPAPFRALIEAEAGAYRSGPSPRVRLAGPEVLVQPQAFSTLALVLHELMTNSAKHGALSERLGEIRVDWEIDPAGRLVIDWVESGGPAVQAPRRRGFGSTIIERAIPHDLGGEARIDYLLAGVRAKLEIPAHLVEVAPARPAPARSAEPAERPPRPRVEGAVLLVEDNMIIALDAEDMLLSLGAARVDMASSAADALRAIVAARPACAVLDVNLGQETSFPVAARLRAAGVPFVFATGYGEDTAFPAELADVPIVKKPYSAEVLGAALLAAGRVEPVGSAG